MLKKSGSFKAPRLNATCNFIHQHQRLRLSGSGVKSVKQEAIRGLTGDKMGRWRSQG